MLRKRSRETNVGLHSYVLDPAWTRVNLVNIPNASKLKRTPVLRGITGDANYLLTSRHLKGRTMAHHFLYDLEFEGVINLELMWAYRSPATKPDVVNYLTKVERAAKRKGAVVEEWAENTEEMIKSTWRIKPTKAWETAVLRSVHSSIRTDRRRIAYEAYDEVGIRSGLRLLFAIAAQHRHVKLDQRIMNESNLYLWFKSLREGSIRTFKPKYASEYES